MEQFSILTSNISKKLKSKIIKKRSKIQQKIE